MSFSSALIGQIMFVGGVILVFYGLGRYDTGHFSLAGAVLCGTSYLGLTLGEELARHARARKEDS